MGKLSRANYNNVSATRHTTPKGLIIGLLLMLASFVSVFAFVNYSKNDYSTRVSTIAAASIEDWTQVYTYTTDASTSTVTITGLKDDYANLDGLIIPSHIAGNPVTEIGTRGNNSTSINPNNTVKTIYFASNSQVTRINSFSMSISSLQYIQLPESLTTMEGSAFRWAGNLKYINIPRNVSHMECAFFSVGSLETVDCDANNSTYKVVDNILYSKNMSRVVLIPARYSGELTIPEGVTRIEQYAACSTPNITKINFPSTLTYIGECNFQNNRCTDLLLPDSLTSIGGWFSANSPTLKVLKLPYNSNTSISYYAFQYCSALTSVTIPEGVKSIGDHCFYECTGLEAVVLPTTLETLGGYSFTKTKITHMQKPYASFVCPETSFTNANSEVTVGWLNDEDIFVYDTTTRSGVTIARIMGEKAEVKNTVKGIRVPASIGGYPVGYLGTDWSNIFGGVTAVSFTPSTTRVDVDWPIYSCSSSYLYFPKNYSYNNSLFSILEGISSVKYFFVESGHTSLTTDTDHKFLMNNSGTTLFCAARVWDDSQTEITIPSTVNKLYLESLLLPSTITKINGLDQITSYQNNWGDSYGSNNSSYIRGSGLTDVTVPYLRDYINLPYISGASKLTTIRFAEGIKTIWHAGSNSNVTNIVLPKSLVLIKTGAFDSYTKAGTVLIPSGCTVEDGAFPSNVTLIYEDQINWENVYNYDNVSDSELSNTSGRISAGTIAITGLKSEYQGLRSVTIPAQIGGKDVTIVRNLNYTTLSEIKFASGSKVSALGFSAITNTNIREITLPATYGGYFGNEMYPSSLNTPVIQNIYVDSANPYYTSVDGVVYGKGSTSSTLYKFPSGRTGEYTVPSNVTQLFVGSFNGTHLTTINIPSSVTKIQHNALNSSTLKNINIEGTISTIGISETFAYNSLLKQDGLFAVPNGVTNIPSNSFNGDTFEAVEIPASVTAIGNSAFRGNTHLKYIIFLGSSPITIDNYAFYGCTSLPSTVVVPDGSTWASNSFPSNVTRVITASNLWKSTGTTGQITPNLSNINNYSGLNTLLVPKTFGGNTVTSYSGNGISLSNIGAIVFPTDSQVTSFTQSSFANSNLKYFYLPSTLSTESGTSMYGTYGYPLTTLYLPDNYEIITSSSISSDISKGRIVDMKNISEFVLSAGNTRYKLIDGNLYTADGTTLVATIKSDTGTFTLPAGVTTIGAHAFYNSKYSHINLNNGSLTTIGRGAFAYCSNLINIAIPSTVSSVGDYAFYGCSKLEHVEMYDSLSLNSFAYGLSRCSSLKGFRFPAATTSTAQSMFYVANVPFVYLNDGLVTIGNSAFHECRGLYSFNIPSTVTTVEGGALAIGTSNFTNLRIYIQGGNNANLAMIDGVLYQCQNGLPVTLIKVTGTAPESVVVPNSVTSIAHTSVGSNTTSITLPSSLRSAENYSFYYAAGLTELVFPEGTTTLRNNLIDYANSLESVTVPGTVTNIATNTFTNNSSVTTITLSQGTTTISSKAFNGLSNLTTINIPYTVSTIAGDAFYNCPKLQITRIPSAMTRIESRAFYGNTAITTITIPNTVEYIGDEAFMNCTNLETVIFESGSPLTSLGSGVFRGCSKLTSITLPENLQSISNSLFRDCNRLKTIAIPSNVTTIGDYAFYGCYNLNAFNFYEGLTGIGIYAFYNTALKDVTLPSTLTNCSEGIFNNCYSLKKITFNNNIITTIGANAFNNCSALERVVLPTSVTNIGRYAFAYTNNLKEINFPTIAYTLESYAFVGTGLKNITIGTNATLASGGHQFESSSLQTVSYASNYSAQNNVPDYAFASCSNLTTVSLPATITQLGNYVFNYGYKLESINLNYITSIGAYTFRNCNVLQAVDLSNVASLGSYAFSNCSKLSSIVSLSSLTSVGSYIFQSCSSLRVNIVLPSGLATALSNGNGQNMFYNSAITGITFPSGTTAIPYGICQNCNNLTAANIPTSVKTINSYAFYNCYNLVGIILHEGLETVNSYAFYYCYNAFGSTFTVPSTLISLGNYACYYTKATIFDLSHASSLQSLNYYCLGTGSTPSYNQTVLMPDASISKLTTFDRAFYNQRVTGTLDVVFNGNAKFDFYYHYYVDSIKITNVDSTKSTLPNTNSAFRYNYYLTNLYLDKTVNNLIYSGDTYLFNQCYNLKSIYIDGAIGSYGRTEPVNFSWVGNTFSIDKSTIKVYVAPADVDTYKAHSYWQAFNVLPHTSNVTVTFNTLFGTAPASQSVQVNSGRITNPGAITCTEGYTFKGYYTYSDNYGYTKITDFNDVVLYQDTTIYCLWDGVDITQYFNFTTYTYNGVSGYAITGYKTNLRYFPDIVIPRQYNGRDIVYLYSYLFDGCKWLNSLDFASDSNVMYIDSYALRNCSNMTKFTFPASIRYTSWSIFQNDYKLATVAFRGNPNLDTFTSNSYSWQSNFTPTTFELIDSTNYVERDGLIYNTDYTTLYLVPRGYSSSSVTLPSTVKVIRHYAFYDNPNLINVNLTESAITHIYDYSFYGRNINNGFVNFENLQYVGSYAFYSSKITSLTFGNKVTTIGGYILYNSNITDFYMYAPETSVSMNTYMFAYAYNLKNVTFVSADTTLKNRMFAGDTALEYIKLGAITNMGSAFTGNNTFSKLKTFIVGDYVSSNFPYSYFPDNLTIIVTRANYSKWGANTSGWDLSRFKIYPDKYEVTFQNDYDPNNCYSEIHDYGTSFELPEVTVTMAEGLYEFIGWFYRNSNGVVVPYTGQAFKNDTTVNAVYNLPLDMLFEYEYNYLYHTATITVFDPNDQFSGGPLQLPQTVQHNGETYRVTSIGNNVFQNKSSVTTLIIPDGYFNIGNYAFENSGLVQIILPSTIDVIGDYAFANIHLDGYSYEDNTPFNVYATTIGERAFSNAGSINYLVLNEGITDIGNSAFEGIDNGYVVSFPNTLVSIGNYAFANTSIWWDGVTVHSKHYPLVDEDGDYAGDDIHDGITFGPNLRSVGQGAFKNNDSLYYMFFSEGLETIGNWAFENTSLGYVQLPSVMESIGKQAFIDTCLYNVTIPYGVELGSGAFRNNQQLHYVTMLGGTDIPDECFRNCHELVSATFGDNMGSVGDNAFRNTESLVYLLDVDGTNTSLSFTRIGQYAFSNSAVGYRDTQLSDKYAIIVDSYTNNMSHYHYYSPEGRYVSDRYYTEPLRELFDEICDEDGKLPGTGYTFEELCDKWEEHYYNWIVLATFDTYDEMIEAYESWTDTDTYEYVSRHDSIKLRYNEHTITNTIFENIYLPNIEYIDEYAFYDSGVRHVHLGPELTTIYSYTFDSSDIETMEFDSYVRDDGSVQGLVNIYARSFQYTYHLQGLDLPDSFDRVNANAFYKSMITYINLNNVSHVAGGAFYDAQYLENITVSSSNSKYRVYKGMLFYTSGNDLNSLVYYPYALSYRAYKEGNWDGVLDFREDLQFHSLRTIYDYAFAHNDLIRRIYFPSGLKLIKDNAFLYCPALQWLQVPSTLERVEEIMYTGQYFFIDGTLDIEQSVPDLTASGMRWLGYSGELMSSVDTDKIIYVPSQDYELYADTIWGIFNLTTYEPGEKITIITLVLNGGTGVTSVPALIGVKLNVGSNPIRNGYKFAGWYWDRALTNKYDMDHVVEDSFTLYAAWNPIEFNFVYHLGGATEWYDTIGANDIIEDFDNDQVTFVYDYEYFPINPFITPYKAGYNFIGWYRKENFESEIIKEMPYDMLTYKESTGDNPVHLYARFERIYYDVDFGTDDAYEISIFAGYTNPVEYGNSLSFTIVYHEGYTQNIDNNNIKLEILTTSKRKDDKYYMQAYEIANVEIGTIIPYTVDEQDGIKVYTIDTPVTDFSVVVNGVVLNKYTINFASNLTRFASGLADMPSQIVVQHGDNLIESSANAEYFMVMYGSPSNSSYLTDTLVNLFGMTSNNAIAFMSDYSLQERTKDSPVNIKKYDNYDAMMAALERMLASDIYYSQNVLVYNPNIVIETRIVGSESINITTPTVNGYVFNSWNLINYDAVSGEIIVATRPYNFNQPITSDITLAATWTLREYTITLALVGGRIGSNDSATATINYTIEQTFMLPYNTDTLKQISRLGYSFGGWYPGVKNGDDYSSDYSGDPVSRITAPTYGNKIFVAKWTENTYDIIYQLASGGYFTEEVRTSENYHVTYTVNSDFDLPIPERIGYDFDGWYETPNFSSGVLAHLYPNTHEGTLVLYPKWSSVSYNIIYHLQGNSISEVTFEGNIINHLSNTATQRYVFNEVNHTEIATEVSRTGYSFNGWYTSDTYEERINYIAAGTFGDIDLYAGWAAVTYTILLNYNVDDITVLVDYDELPATFTFTFDGFIDNGSIPVMPNDLEFADDSMHFAGWYSNGYQTNYITPSNYEITRLTASWRNAEYYMYVTSNDVYATDVNNIVRIVGEDGDISNVYGGSLRFMIYYTNRAYSKSTPTVTYKLSNIRSADKADWVGITAIPLTVGDDGFYYINEVNGNLMLFIDGLTINQYTVSFIDEDGSELQGSVQVRHGDNIASLPNPTKTGYSFGGWYIDTGRTTRYDVNSAVESDTILYAKFGVKTYHVLLKNNVNENTITLDYSRGNEINFVSTTAPWIIVGYTAPTQYRVCDSAGNPTITPITSTNDYAQDLIVMAYYTLTPYNITYGIEPGVTHGNPATYTINDNIILSDAIREGYKFNYWSNEQGNKVMSIPRGSTGDIVLIANFTLNSDNYVSVQYYDNYTKLREEAIYKGQPLLEDLFRVPAKTGYTAIGWYSDVELQTPYVFGSAIIQNVTLYAKYTLDTYDLSFEYELYDSGVFVRTVNSSKVINANYDEFDVITNNRLSTPNSPGLRFIGWYYDDGIIETTSELPAQNCTIVGRFAYITYSIVYTIPSGMATGIGDNVEEFNIDTPTIRFSSPTGIDPGYDFVNWVNTLDSAQIITSIPQGTIGDVYLTGQFVSKENYIVVEFYIGNTLETSTKINKGTNALRPTIGDRAGYRLSNWFFSPTCTGTTYNFVDALNESTKFYAQWNVQNYSITVKYSRSPQSLPTIPTTYNITSIINLPTLEDIAGYTFGGWWTGVVITGNNYDYSNATKIGSIIGSTGTLTIVARFDVVNYSINYEGLEGTYDLPNTYNIESNDIDLDDYDTPQKEGYIFTGWSILNGNSWDELTDNVISHNLAKDVYLRAEYDWIPTNTILTRYLDGEFYAEDIVEIGDVLDLDEPNKAGYTFDGWYFNSDYTGDKIVSIDTASPTSGYGRMIPITYHATYASNLSSAVLPAGNITEFTVETPKFELISPAAIFGYTFMGWYTGATYDGHTYNFDDATKVDIIYQNANDLDLVARFELTVFTITYQLGYGTNAPLNVTTYTIESGTIMLYAPTAPENKEFTHWEYVDGEYSETWESFEADVVAKNITLYARYNDLRIKSNTTEIIIIAAVIGGALTFFAILTYSIIGGARRRKLADNKRIQELLSTLSREQNANKPKSSGYRDDFRI